MKLHFTIPGYAKAQGRHQSVALLPKGGKALRHQAQEILKFYGDNPIPPKERQTVADALNLEARSYSYQAPADRDWLNTLRWHMIQERQEPLWEGPVIVEATFFFLVPKSYKRWIHEAVARGEHVPVIVGRGDPEQLIKPVLDACKGFIWRDDRLVYRCVVERLYGLQPKLELMLELVEERRPR